MLEKTTIVLVAIFLVGSSAFATDGDIKFYLGYSLEKLGNTAAWDISSDSSTEVIDEQFTAFAHGPSVDARYEKDSLFVRGTFDYRFLQSAKWRWDDEETAPGKGNLFWIEADIGKKVWSKDSMTLSPYVGLGYLSLANDLRDEEYGHRLNAPFASIGAIAICTKPEWTIGFEGTLMILLFAKSKEVASEWSDTFDHGLGFGLRLQIPFTYHIAKKDNSDLVIFAAPSWLYMQTDKSEVLVLEDGGMVENWEGKQSLSLLALKVGVCLSF
ncbi:MAG: hypothetical protein MUO43_00500 [Desulfobacterales bacterium]|nr:hypothetical protein [Desulfobacterales bacterium]